MKLRTGKTLKGQFSIANDKYPNRQRKKASQVVRSYCPRCCRLLTNAQWFVSACFTGTCKKGNPWLTE